MNVEVKETMRLVSLRTLLIQKLQQYKQWVVGGVQSAETRLILI